MANTRPHPSSPCASRKELRRARYAHRHAQALTRSFLDGVRRGCGIDAREIKTMVSECVRCIMRCPDTLLWLGKMHQHEEDTAAHSLNTSLLAIAFGRYLGAAEEDLNRLGVAGLLHDIGKMHIPPELLYKAGPLDADEFSVMQRHTQQGHDILRDHGGTFHGAMDVAYSHHENLDGSGYPRRITSADISSFTRIVMLCDVYDAITSDRIYRKGSSPQKALRFISDQTGIKFDPRLARQFTRFIGPYPPGSIVELHSGEVAIVIGPNTRHRHLPTVMVLRDADKNPVREHALCLEKLARANPSPLIREVLPNGSQGIHIGDYIEKGLTLDNRR